MAILRKHRNKFNKYGDLQDLFTMSLVFDEIVDGAMEYPITACIFLIHMAISKDHKVPVFESWFDASSYVQNNPHVQKSLADARKRYQTELNKRLGTNYTSGVIGGWRSKPTSDPTNKIPKSVVRVSMAITMQMFLQKPYRKGWIYKLITL